ncbi:AraC family transcriptional regulator [Paraburkholderia solisilvae]|uniref:Transcriptional activator NphR n=1 Tax=Paraburkholderia solisilvae TaxID=624376 RepID=A0A6J5EVT6_9BURK|nr:AraC family transcriptional regulator [Paraburkholderia solisilvae]CAB3770708.1 Transcriptional activator NphR [Paraburkholderia solisilvae]
MNTLVIDNAWRARIDDRDEWIETLSDRCGVRCTVDGDAPRNACVKRWQTGPLRLADVELAHHRLVPIRNSPAYEDQLLFKVVCSGSLTIESKGEQRRLERGDMVLVDPRVSFSESFAASTRIVALHIPKLALRERALRDQVGNLYTPNVECADTRAIREFVLFMAREARTVSRGLLDRFGDHCLELLVSMLDDASLSSYRSAETIALRARQIIASRFGDRSLTIERLASELNISKSHLHRVLRAHGESAMHYLWTLRTERAAQLLSQSPLGAKRTSEIAWQCGFATAAHFCRLFKQRYGVSPQAFAEEAAEQAAAKTLA